MGRPDLQDNYVWILSEASSGMTAVVDPSEAAPVAAALEDRWAACHMLIDSQHAAACPSCHCIGRLVTKVSP